MSLSKCIDDVIFFYIQENGDSSVKLPSVASSIVGHARPNEELLVSPGIVSDSSKSLLAAMSPTNSTFSTRFRREFISWVDYGNPDVAQRNGVPAELKANKDMFWSVNSGGVRFGDFQADSYSWSFDPNQTVTGRAEEVYTIFDSASTQIYISELWFESFIEEYFFIQNIEYAVVDGKVAYTCQNSSLNHIYYMVDGYYLMLDQIDLTGEI